MLNTHVHEPCNLYCLLYCKKNLTFVLILPQKRSLLLTEVLTIFVRRLVLAHRLSEFLVLSEVDLLQIHVSLWHRVVVWAAHVGNVSVG